MCNRTIKGELNQWMIWGLQNLELIKNENMTFLMENFTRADVKARLYLIDFKLPAKHAGCHFSLISDVTPSIPIYLFSLTASKQYYHFWNSVIMDRNLKCLVGNLKSIRLKRALAPALVKFSLEKSYFHFFY
jgi:hypothetical protein